MADFISLIYITPELLIKILIAFSIFLGFCYLEKLLLLLSLILY